MQDKPLLSITIITDDDTGMYRVGDLDFGIHGRLYSYLEKDPIKNRDKVLSMIGYLSHRVCDMANEMIVEDQDKACSV